MFYKNYNYLFFIFIILACDWPIFPMDKESIQQGEVNLKSNTEIKNTSVFPFQSILEKLSFNRFVYSFNLETHKHADPLYYPLSIPNGNVTFISQFDIPRKQRKDYFNSLIDGILHIKTNKNPIVVIAGAEEAILSQYKKRNESIDLPLIARFPKLIGGLLCLTTAIATITGEHALKKLELIPKLLALFSYFHQ